MRVRRVTHQASVKPQESSAGSPGKSQGRPLPSLHSLYLLDHEPVTRSSYALGLTPAELENTAAGFSIEWPTAVDQFEPVPAELFNVVSRVGMTHFNDIYEDIATRHAADLGDERKTRMNEFKGCSVGVNNINET